MKDKLKAVWEIFQTELILLLGIAALALSQVELQVKEYKLIALGVGVVATLVGLAPQVVAFYQAKMPKGEK